MNKRLLLVPLAAAAAGIVAYTASATTGANFSDTKTGVISGNIATIQVTGSGGNNNVSGGTANMDLQFPAPLQPGVLQSVTSTYTNTGNVNETIYLVFNDANALHAINQLGTFGEAHMANGGTEFFASQNLNDGYPCGTPGLPGVPTLCAIPRTSVLATNVAPGYSNTFTFTFAYEKLSNPAAEGAPFNGTGLPYSFVAEQVNSPAP